jgi:hypothetical protein
MYVGRIQKEDYSSYKTYKWMLLVSFGNYKKLQRRKKRLCKQKRKKRKGNLDREEAC